MNIPGVEDRTIVVGRTGSGKTFGGLWLLTMQDFNMMPWVIIDFKRDQNIGNIPWVQQISVNEMPAEPGLYLMRPTINQMEEVEAWLYAAWERENIGIFIDEGVMLAKSAALDTILIQGRSKHVPVILLTQRPVGISRFAFSESGYMMIFPTHDRREQKIISEFSPLFQDKDSDDANLPRFHSHYYDVVNRTTDKLGPVPNMERMMKTFDKKLRPPDEPKAMEDVPRKPAPIFGGDVRIRAM